MHRRREAHQQFVCDGEQQLAKEMSFRDVNERAKNAHTLGTATLTNKIERMHRRGREKEVHAWISCQFCVFDSATSP